MPNYIVNTRSQPNGDHEVHETTCSRKPLIHHQHDLGWHADCHSALRQAKQIYPTADGCAFCCPACHKS